MYRNDQVRASFRRSIAGKIAVVVAVLGLAPYAAFAQGSSFDLLGFGEPIASRNAHIQSIGGAGTGLTDPRIVSDLNPASWSFMNRARLETGGRWDYTSSTQGDLFSTGSNFRFDGFAFGAPFWNDYAASLSLGFQPLTDAAAAIKSTDTAGTRSYRSEGGVSMGYIGAAFQASSGIAIGARFDLLFGNVRHVSQVTFEDANIASGDFQRAYAVHGLRGSFGLLLNGDSLGSGFKGLSLGASFTPGVSLTVTRRTEITPLNTALDTTIESKGTGNLPSTIAVGIGAKFETRYRVSADLKIENYSSAYLFSDQSSSAGDPLLRNSTRIGIGIERFANISQEFGSSGFWSNLGLRFGGYYYQTPFNPVGSGGINEMALTAGIGIPFGLESTLDLSLTAGQRTPTNVDSAPKDQFFRLGVTLGFAEKWFNPTRREE